MASRVQAAQVKKIVFACEAGMGSSLIGASLLRKLLKAAGLDVRVEHTPVHSIPRDAQVVICHEGLAGQARAKAPWAVVMAFQTFINNPVYGRIVQTLKDGTDIEETA